MHQEAVDELRRGETHDLLAVTAFDPVIFPTESHSVGIGADEAVVRDRDAVGIAAEISQYRLRPAKGRLGIYHPFGLAKRREPFGEGGGVGHSFVITEEGKLSRFVQSQQSFNEQAAKQARQHVYVQEEPGLAGHPSCAIRRQSAAGDDHVDVRVMGECRSPGMQNAGHADLRAEAFWIGGYGHHGLR